MLFASKDKNGDALPAELIAALWDPATKITAHVAIDFAGDGTFVEVPSDDVLSIDFSDEVEGQNGRACSNKCSVELSNYNHRYSPHKFTDDYTPSIMHFNGPDQGDGRGNLRPERRISIDLQVDGFSSVVPGRYYVPIFEGLITGDGFVEDVGHGNINKVKLAANDYAILLKKKDPKGVKKVIAGQWVEETLAWRDCKVSDPADQANSIIHKLVAMGDPDGWITVDAETFNVPIEYIPIDTNMWSEIAELADFMHCTASFFGKTLFFGDSEFNTVTASPIEFTNSHYEGINHRDNADKIYNKLSIEFGQYIKLPKTALWMHPNSAESGIIQDGGCVYDLSDAEKIPDLFNEMVIYKAPYTAEVNTPTTRPGYGGTGIVDTKANAANYEVVTAENISYHYYENGLDTELLIFDTTTYRDAAIIRAAIGGRTSVRVTKLVVFGEPVIQEKAITSFIDNADSIALYGTKIKEYKNKYMNQEIITFRSQQWTRDRAWLQIAIEQNAVPRRDYTFSLSMPLIIARSGTRVRLQETYQGSEINVMVNLQSIGIKYNGQKAEWTTTFKAVEYKTESGATTTWSDTSPRPDIAKPVKQILIALGQSVDQALPYNKGDLMSYRYEKESIVLNDYYIAVVSKGPDDAFSWDDWELVDAENQLFKQTLFIRSASTPDTPTGVAPEGWTDIVPDGTDPVWQSTATLRKINSTVTVVFIDWSTPLSMASISGGTPVPGTVTNLSAVAYQDYIKMNMTIPAGAVSYIFQRSKDEGASWEDITGTADGEAACSESGYMWPFNRATDKYPEKTLELSGVAPLSKYRFRAKASNVLGQTSASWSSTVPVDDTAYKTWKPVAPTGAASQTAMRAASISWVKPDVYNIARHEVQISKDNTTWFEPAVGLNVYPETVEEVLVSNEGNWRQSNTANLFKTTPIEQWNQELPLEGQGAGLAVNTVYYYRMRTVVDVPQAADDAPNGVYASSGKRAGPWCTGILAMAKATSAYDLVANAVTSAHIVDGAVVASKIFVENLAAIIGNLSAIQGGADDPNNYWMLTDFPGKPVDRMVGELRAGGAKSFIKVTPDSTPGADDGDLQVEGLDLIMKNGKIQTYKGVGEARRRFSQEDTSLVWTKIDENGDPIFDIARIDLDPDDSVKFTNIYSINAVSPELTELEVVTNCPGDTAICQYDGKIYIPHMLDTVMLVNVLDPANNSYSSISLGAGVSDTTRAAIIVDGILYMAHDANRVYWQDLTTVNTHGNVFYTGAGGGEVLKGQIPCLNGQLYLYNAWGYHVFDIATKAFVGHVARASTKILAAADEASGSVFDVGYDSSGDYWFYYGSGGIGFPMDPDNGYARLTITIAGSCGIVVSDGIVTIFSGGTGANDYIARWDILNEEWLPFSHNTIKVACAGLLGLYGGKYFFEGLDDDGRHGIYSFSPLLDLFEYYGEKPNGLTSALSCFANGWLYSEDSDGTINSTEIMRKYPVGGNARYAP